jgi:hypothetical protein
MKVSGMGKQYKPPQADGTSERKKGKASRDKLSEGRL